MTADDPIRVRRITASSTLMGFALAIVVSGGIVHQRLLGSTTGGAIGASAMTTLVAVAAVLATVRTFLTSFDAGTFGPRAREHRIAWLVTGQTIGAIAGVLAMHAVVLHELSTHPWLREHPRQLVNDLVAIFGVLAFIWGCAHKPIRPAVMIAGLAVVLGYELTDSYWHLDAPAPVAQDLSWSVQRFVGSEVTASGIGVLAFRLLLA